MTRLLAFCAARPWPVWVVVVALSVLAAAQLDDLRIHISSEELLVMDGPEHRDFERIVETFGDEQSIVLFLSDERLLAKPKLAALRDAIGAIEQLPFVARVQSLFSVPRLRTVDGFLSKEPYLAELPESEHAAAELLAEALKNPFLKHTLLSADGRAMVIAIGLKSGPQKFDDETITAKVDAAASGLSGHYESVFSIGFPYVRSEIAQRIRAEQSELFPLAAAALVLVLLFLLRQLVDVLLPVVTAVISILWTLGAMAAAEIPLNVITSIAPILLIIVGSTEDIHLLSEFRQARHDGLSGPDALRRMAKKMGRTVFLTFVTTFVGFLSIGLSGIEVLWQFGVVSAIGLLFNFLVTISVIPATLSLTGAWQLDGRTSLFSANSCALAQSYWAWLRRHRQSVVYTVVALTFVAALGLPKIQVRHNVLESLGEVSQVRGRLDELNQRFAGLETLSVVLYSGIQDTFLKVRYLEELLKIQEFVEGQDYSASATSFANHLSLLNAAFDELDEPSMPASDAIVSELMLFLGFDHVREYVSRDFSQARILVRHNVTDTARLHRFVADLRAFIRDNLDAGLDARVTGDSVLTLSATRAMMEGQLQSIGLLLAIIVFIVSILFADLRVGIIALVPNVLPIVVMFGVMGYADIPLNVGTAMAAAVAIGIAVDDTMHFMLRYNQELKSSKSQTRAMHTAIHSEAVPVLSTSLALMAGFLVFLQSDFQPIAQFGLLSAVAIGTALFADLMVTPLVVSSLRLITLWDLLSPTVRERVLLSSRLFKGMRSWQVRRFVASSTTTTLAPGEYVFRAGDASNELYMVISGEIEVRFPGHTRENPIRENFGAGEVFGEVALLAADSRRTDAVAVGTTRVLVLSREAMENTTRYHPGITANLFHNLSVDISRRMIGVVSKLRRPMPGRRGDDGRDDESR